MQGLWKFHVISRRRKDFPVEKRLYYDRVNDSICANSIISISDPINREQQYCTHNAPLGHYNSILRRNGDRALDKRFTRHRHRYGRRGSKSRANIRWSWNDSRPITTVSNRSNPLRFIYCRLMDTYGEEKRHWRVTLQSWRRASFLKEKIACPTIFPRKISDRFEKRIRIGVTKFDFRVLQVSTRYKDKKIRMLKRKEGVYLVRKEFVSTEGEEWKARELWFARTTSFAYLFRAGDSRLRSTLKSNFPLYAGHSLCSRDIRFFTLSKTSPNLRFLNFRGGLGGAFLGF